MKGIIFDRDGTLVEFVHFLFKEEQVCINKDMIPTLKYLNKLSAIKIFMHTNQSGVCRGMFSIKDVENCNKKFQQIISTEYEIDLFFENIFIAPSFNSIYRKPTSNVVTELVRNYNLKKKDILYIGDTLVDYQTAIDSGTECIIYRGYASKPIDQELQIENQYIAKNDLELLSMVKRFINEGND